MDVDDRVGRDESVAQDLHVASHHDEFDAVLVERLEHGRLLLDLGVRCHGEMEVLDAHVGGDVGVIGVVRHDHSEIHRQFAAAPTGEEVVEAMWLLRRHDRRRGRNIAEAKVDVHPQAFGRGSEGLGDLTSVEAEPVEFELDSLEEDGVAAPAPVSTCCSACTMLPSCSAMNCAVAATTPRWSGHESNSTAVIGVRSIRNGDGVRNRPPPLPPRR